MATVTIVPIRIGSSPRVRLVPEERNKSLQYGLYVDDVRICGLLPKLELGKRGKDPKMKETDKLINDFLDQHELGAVLTLTPT